MNVHEYAASRSFHPNLPQQAPSSLITVSIAHMIAKGCEVFKEGALVAVQTPSSASSSLSCSVCLCYIGGWRAQAHILTEGATARNRCKQTAVKSGLAHACVNECCQEAFCSQACLIKGIRTGHHLECGIGVICTKNILACSEWNSSDANNATEQPEVECCGASAASAFRKHSIQYDETYLLARKLIITLLAPVVYSTEYVPHTQSCCSVDHRNNLSSSIQSICHLVHSVFSLPGQNISSINNCTADADNIHDSWVLLMTAFTQMDICVSCFEPLLSYDFYSWIIRYVIPVHMKMMRCAELENEEGIEGCARIPSTDACSPLHRRLQQACIAGVFELPLNTLDGDSKDLVSCISSLFPPLFKSSYNVSLSLLSLLDPGTDVYDVFEADRHSVGSVVASSKERLDGSISVCMTLLSQSSAFIPHSCIPSISFTHIVPGAAQSGSDLLPSVVVTATAEATRDISCMCNCLNNVAIHHRCECGDKGLSISYIPDLDCSDHIVRQRALKTLFSIVGSDFQCVCMRCEIESKEFSYYCMEKYDSDALLALAYLYMQLQQYGLAQKVLNYVSHEVSDKFIRAKASHALGAALLEQGDWLAARKLWLDALPLASAYPLLNNEIQKQQAYPVYTSSNLQDSSTNTVMEFEILSWSGDRETLVMNLGEFRDMYETLAVSPTQQVYITNKEHPILNTKECSYVVSLAEAYADQSEWSTSRHYAVPTTDIPVNRVPELLIWFNDVMKSRIVPMISMQLVDDRFTSVGASLSVSVHDAFVVKYDGRIGHGDVRQILLPMHRDQSAFSFVLALNGQTTDALKLAAGNGYSGGGTYFATSKNVYCPDAGHMLSFAGGNLLHGGSPVTNGIRYILAVFLNVSSCESSKDCTTTKDIGPSLKKSKIEFSDSAHHTFSFAF